MIDADKRIKVGHSYNLPDRLCKVQYDMTGGRRPIRLVKAIECDNATRAEARTHKLLKAMGLWDSGEWFLTTPPVASRMLNRAIRQLEEERATSIAWLERYRAALDEIKTEKGEKFTRAKAHRLWGPRTRKRR